MLHDAKVGVLVKGNINIYEERATKFNIQFAATVQQQIQTAQMNKQ